MVSKPTFLLFFCLFFLAAPLQKMHAQDDAATGTGLQELVEKEKEAHQPDILADLTVKLDTGWTILAAVLVMFMQAGFAMLTAGFVRSKNTCNMLIRYVGLRRVNSSAFHGGMARPIGIASPET